jgi:hypothetical protein
VLGRLPLRYRVTVWIVGLLTCAATGAWLALMTPVPLLWGSGAFLGVLFGVLAVLGFVHLLEAEPEEPQTPQAPPAH